MTSIEYLLPNHRNCPRCDGDTIMTDWRPGFGLDPAQRQYRGTACSHTHYFTPKYPILKHVNERPLL